MHDTKNQHVLVFHSVHDDIFSDGKAAVSRAEVVLARAPEIGKARQRHKTVGDGVDQPVGRLEAAALFRNVILDTVKIGFGPGARRCAISGTR